MKDDLVGWDDLASIVVQALHQLNCEKLIPFAKEWLAELPNQFHADADQACRIFLQNGEWPTIDEPVRLLLVLRCLHAIDRLSSRFCRGDHRQIDKGSHHIELYLIDDWHRDHAQWLKFRNPNGSWNLLFDPWL